MKETGLIFTPDNAEKAHRGTKTQTRRIMKPQPHAVQNNGWIVWQQTKHRAKVLNPEGDVAPFCPYGQPGDRLWVREAWLPDPPRDGTWADVMFDGCGMPLYLIPERFRTPQHCLYEATWDGSDLKWKNSMFMPKWACRTWCELVEVRVQRIQEISYADADAEGVIPEVENLAKNGGNALIDAFIDLWESKSVHGPGAWERNDWVWCLTFKRIE